MSDRLNKSLDDIIKEGRKVEAVGNIRGHDRRGRRNEPYNERERRPIKRGGGGDAPVVYDRAIKFLLDNAMSGCIIGTAGFAMKDLIEITNASIHISSSTRRHPITDDRVLFISGTEESVGLAQALVWEMLGQQTDATNTGLVGLVWNPAAARAAPGQYDDVEVACDVAIPAASAGRVLGRGGHVLRGMKSECDVEVTMSPVEESELLQERIVSIKGTVGGCMRFTSLLLSKIAESAEESRFLHSGTAYPVALRGPAEAGNGNGNGYGRSRGGHYAQPTNVGIVGSKRGASDDSSFVRHTSSRRSDNRSALQDVVSNDLTISAVTTIELAVPNAYIGAILGVQGTKLAEIKNLSGAQIRISDKGEYVRGTTNRIVRIEGTPMCAQTAQTLIMHKVRQEMSDKSD